MIVSREIKYQQSEMVCSECSSCSNGTSHSLTGFCSYTCQLEAEIEKLKRECDELEAAKKELKEQG